MKIKVKVKVKVKDIKSNSIMAFTLFIFVLITLVSSLGTIGMPVALCIFLLVCFCFVYKLSKGGEVSTILATPILLSVFQNVYLGLFSPRLSSTVVQILTVLNFLLAFVIFAFLALRYHKTLKGQSKYFNLFIAIVGYSLVSIVFLNEINVISIISSFRNIISVFLFFFIGYYASRRMELNRFENILLIFGIIVIAVGFYDVLSGGIMWKELNITDLWTKKGIRVQPSGLPTNFYSSETINGERIRRMASTFADPVNLGSFLFAIFTLAWHRNKKMLAVLMIIGMVLTVSKGAWLGLLIFMCVYAFYYLPTVVFGAVAGVAGLAGVGFLVYAFLTSANSVFLHISGLLAALRGLTSYPLGAGIGSNGVLARQFSGFSVNADVTETGLGMIISQLGIVGLFIYIAFFWYIIKQCMKTNNKRDRVLVLSLVLSVVLNIFFNEVALSPNTCATYFIVVGYVMALNRNGEHDIYCQKIHKDRV